MNDKEVEQRSVTKKITKSNFSVGEVAFFNKKVCAKTSYLQVPTCPHRLHILPPFLMLNRNCHTTKITFSV